MWKLTFLDSLLLTSLILLWGARHDKTIPVPEKGGKKMAKYRALHYDERQP